MKTCKKCGETKALEAFVKARTCRDGRAGTCRDCQNAYFRDWRHRNLTANRAREREYRRRRNHGSTLKLEPAYAEALLGDPCTYCGAVADTFDHIEPLHHGGADDWDNLTPACKRCNASKQDRPLLLFMAQTNGCYEFRRDRVAA